MTAVLPPPPCTPRAVSISAVLKLGAELVLAQFLIELGFLGGRKNLPGTAIEAFLTF